MFRTNIRIAIESLRQSRVRTGLTTLGIVIGVTTITLVLSISDGVRNELRQQLGGDSKHVIAVRSGRVERDASGMISGYDVRSLLGATTLTERDAETVARTPGVEAAAPLMQITGSIRSDDERAGSDAVIAATTPDFQRVHQLETTTGQFLENDIDSNTAVLGNRLAIDLYGTDDAIGRVVTLRGQPFTVIGVLKNQQEPINISTINFNQVALINLGAGKDFNQGIAQIQQINAKPREQNAETSVANAIKTAILANHNGEEDFAIIRPDEASRITDATFDLITLITSAIAGVSLVVGGIGIMNIMLVSVSERTREIGIRKAVGATNAQIMTQFLIESAIMSLVGGIIGVLITAIVAAVTLTFFGFAMVISPLTIAISLGVAVGVGIVFGLFPAVRAARKDPIAALRMLH